MFISKASTHGPYFSTSLETGMYGIPVASSLCKPIAIQKGMALALKQVAASMRERPLCRHTVLIPSTSRLPNPWRR